MGLRSYTLPLGSGPTRLSNVYAPGPGVVTGDYLVVGGGGGGGHGSTNSRGAGGGGAGALVTGTRSLAPGALTITIGAGGLGGTDQFDIPGFTGGDSSIGATVAVGGGGGGCGEAGVGEGGNATTGACGGGAGDRSGSNWPGAPGTVGFKGGDNATSTSFGGSGAGGGGMGGPGANGVSASATPSAGGVGLASSISGAPVTYAAGGPGGAYTGGAVGPAAAANTGNGGGGSQGNTTLNGGPGGSGIAIIAYPTGALTATGGVITQAGGKTIHTFLASGSFTVTAVTGGGGLAPNEYPYPKRVIADGASHYWRLNESSGVVATDLVGGAPGTITGGVTLGVPGAVAGDNAMTFNGTTGHVVATVIPLGPVFTIEAWVKTVSTAFMEIAEINNIQFYVNGGSLGANVGGVSANTFYPVADGQWHHVVLVSTGAVMAQYADGAFKASGLAVASMPGTQFYIGRYWGSGLNFFNGAIDEVAIYPRVLSLAEIAAHYALGPTLAFADTDDLPFRQLLLAADPANTSALTIGDATVAVGVEGIVIPAAPAPARYPYLNIGPFESGPVKLSHIYVAGVAGQFIRILGIPY